jgi:hypothetical protein
MSLLIRNTISDCMSYSIILMDPIKELHKYGNLLGLNSIKSICYNRFFSPSIYTIDKSLSYPSNWYDYPNKKYPTNSSDC